MDNTNYQALPSTAPTGLHWGHFGIVMVAMVLLLGMSWLKNPKLFDLKKADAVAVNDPSVPHYYAYVQPAEDTVPLVAGASTDEGPVVISDDGSNNVIPVNTDAGQVLGASTQDVQLSLGDVKVDKVVPDTDANIKKYFADSGTIESSPIDNSEFEVALTSADQNQINAQAAKLNAASLDLQKISVPQSLVTLQKLKIIQYSAAVGILQNFTQADQNPQLVGDKLQEFLKSQQDLDTETASIAQKFPNDVPASIAVTQAQDLQSLSIDSQTGDAQP